MDNYRPKNVDTMPRQAVHNSTTDLSADLDLPTGTQCPGNVSTKSASKYRTRIHERLSGEFIDVEMILASWKDENKCSPTLVKAIRLMDAINKGDLAAALGACPELGLLVDRSPQPRRSARRSPSLRSESYTDPESIEKSDPEKSRAKAALIPILANLTGLDAVIHETKLDTSAEVLYRSGNEPYLVAELATWKIDVWPTHWKAKRGQVFPGLIDIEETIGQVRLLPVTAVPAPTAAQVASPPTNADVDADLERIKARYTAATPEWTGRLANLWQMERNQLSVQLNRSTFDTWLGHMKLIEVTNQDKFIFTVPHRYSKDWIEAHLLRTIRCRLTGFRDHIVNPAAVNKLPEDQTVEVEIYVESEYMP